MVVDFVDGGAEDEFTLGENRRAFSDLGFRPRVLVDVAERPQAGLAARVRSARTRRRPLPGHERR